MSASSISDLGQQKLYEEKSRLQEKLQNEIERSSHINARINQITQQITDMTTGSCSQSLYPHLNITHTIPNAELNLSEVLRLKYEKCSLEGEKESCLFEIKRLQEHVALLKRD